MGVLSGCASRGRCCTAFGTLRGRRPPWLPQEEFSGPASRHWLAESDPVYPWTVNEVLTQRLTRSRKVPKWTSEGLDEDPFEAPWELCI